MDQAEVPAEAEIEFISARVSQGAFSCFGDPAWGSNNRDAVTRAPPVTQRLGGGCDLSGEPLAYIYEPVRL